VIFLEWCVLWLMINMILAVTTSYIIYNTALSFLGLYMPFKRTVFPILLFTVLLYISKVVFKAPPIVHTIIMVNICVLIIYLFNRVNFILNLCASLSIVIIIIIGNLLIVCPILNKLGISLANINFNTLDWIILNIGELSIPTIFLIVSRTNKLSLIKQILNK
jgi:hypothetical protein